jgi:hypothetical protein
LRLGLLLVAIPLLAQQSAPIGLVHGSLLECDPGSHGELTMRTADNQVFRFLFDSNTYFEREQQPASAARLEKGDWLEIVSDKSPKGPLRYARTVQVIERPAPGHVRRRAALLRAYRSAAEEIFPRGDLTFSGVVERLNAERMVLHTRGNGREWILLRPDTRYLENGQQVEASALEPNMRVFVRAGKNLDNQVEAYQVVWGQILEPR